MITENLKKDLDAALEKYGYRVHTYKFDERTGRSSHQKPTLELVLDPIEDPEPTRSFWID